MTRRKVLIVTDSLKGVKSLADSLSHTCDISIIANPDQFRVRMNQLRGEPIFDLTDNEESWVHEAYKTYAQIIGNKAVAYHPRNYLSLPKETRDIIDETNTHTVAYTPENHSCPGAALLDFFPSRRTKRPSQRYVPISALQPAAAG